tara:strand:+ start:9486 stop:9947 length:462 start_codon:yes stop_codon:yes gene_type:complete
MYSKHIEKHAKKIADAELNKHLKFYREHIPNSYDKQNTTEAKEQYLKDSAKYYGAELTRIKKALLNGRFYAGVKSVSSSGMSRTITLAYIYKNKLHTIRDKNILALAGVSANGRIGGCGMDMLFHAQYTLFNNLHRSYKEANYTKRLKQYNNI